LLEANTGRDPRVHIHDCALGEADAALTLAVPLDERGNPVSALARVGAAVAGEQSLAVRVRALDALVASGELTLEQPVLAKIDVEGHEGAVLAGARRLLEAGAAIYFESQEGHLDRPGSTSPWPVLREAGYEVVVRDGDGWRRCDGPIAGRPNYLGLPGGTLPAGEVSHAALVATLARWVTA
jgi:FkbM family methyltransferase